MPRGIGPVVALLIIASAFSQFGGTGLPATLGFAPQASPSSGARPASTKTSQAHKNLPSTKTNPSDFCKDLTPCVPRIDLGPWNASCRYSRAYQDTPPRSPMVALNLAKPISDTLPVIANRPDVIDPMQVPDVGLNDLDSLNRWCLNKAVVSITALVVTLPDPVNSHLALDFDRRIDAIQAAALDAWYALDQFWLPWDAVGIAEAEDPEKAGKERVLRQLRQNQPGLLIFRSRESEHPKALFVFLVGETPTRGVNLSQFENAIAYVREIQTANHQSTTSEIKILGPGFSGSIPLLSETLKQQIAGKACCFEIIPSSATDHDLLGMLRETVSGAGTVHSVLHDDDAALERFLNYANDILKIRPADIAIVSESETAFGSGEFNLDSAPATPSARSPASARPAPEKLCRFDTRDLASSLRACTLRLSFPREIYRLRSAYPDQPQLAAGSKGEENQPTSGLTLNLKTSTGREDDLPSFSGEQIPLSQEAIMLSIAETIHRRKIKMVGVAASDVFDTLFVLRFLQQFCPDARLFVLDSDLLLIRAADNLSLQGTLAVTDYPLSSVIQSWQGNDRAVRTFPSRNAELTYNAFLALIGESDRMRDYSFDSGDEAKSQDRKTRPLEPLLWLTVVSRNGFQPVHLLPHAESEGDAVPLAGRPVSKPDWVTKRTPSKLEIKPEYPSGGYLLLCALLLGGTLTHLGLAFYGERCEVTFLGWVIEFFHICDNSDARTQKAYLLSNSFIILAVLDFIVFLPIWRITYERTGEGLNSLWYTLVSILSIGAMIIITTVGARLSARHRILNTPEGGWLLVSWVIAITYFAMWIRLALLRGNDSYFFLQRSLDLSNGTSPLLPHLLLLIAFYLWSMTNLRRVHFWENRREDLDFASIDAQFRSHFAELGLDLDTALGKMFFYKRSWIIVVVVLGIFLLLRPFSHISGFEPFLIPGADLKLFDAVYVLYLLLCTTFLVHALLRFVVCWAALQKILRRLERQPIRHAFDRLPKRFYSWSPLWHSGGARRNYALQAHALECLRKLSACRKAPPLSQKLVDDLPGLVNQLQASTSRLLDAEAANYLDHQAESELWKANLIATADRIASDFLIPSWKAVGGSESLSGDGSNDSKSDSGARYLSVGQPPDGNEVHIVAEEFVALRFVAFMRYVGVQLRNLLSFVVAGFILCVASVRSYPFLAHRSIGWALSLLFIALGIPVVIAFAQMDKDAILSRLSDTQPGKLDRAFYVRLVSYGALPLLTVLASQFPPIGRFLFSWVQPAIEALH